jgi:Na+/proline symporter
MDWGSMMAAIGDDKLSRVFFFDDVNSRQFFWKQFLAGVFTQIAMNGLDQDMMQRNLSCRNSKESQMNMVVSMVLQFVVISIFLMLGALLYIFVGQKGIVVEKSDTLFTIVATGGYLPLIVGILFIIGLTASAYSAAGSALTALTTSFTVDILGIKGKAEEEVKQTRQRVHIGMAIVMGISIVVFNLLNNTSVIDAVYILASYTYGPILGMFAFGILTKWKVRDKLIPFVAILAPLLCFILDKNSVAWFNGYQFSYEILIMNALFTFIGLCLIKTNK